MTAPSAAVDAPSRRPAAAGRPAGHRRDLLPVGPDQGRGLLHITDGTYELFRTEYALPLVPPDIAAHRRDLFRTSVPDPARARPVHAAAALALLGMTLVIEIFVYPDAWPTHLSWAAILLPLIARGGGNWSLDALLRRKLIAS